MGSVGPMVESFGRSENFGRKRNSEYISFHTQRKPRRRIHTHILPTKERKQTLSHRLLLHQPQIPPPHIIPYRKKRRLDRHQRPCTLSAGTVEHPLLGGFIPVNQRLSYNEHVSFIGNRGSFQSLIWMMRSVSDRFWRDKEKPGNNMLPGSTFRSFRSFRRSLLLSLSILSLLYSI